MHQSSKAHLILLFVAVVWGVAFVFQRMGMAFVGPLLFNGLRFALGGALVFCFLCIMRRRSGARVRPSRGALQTGAVLGVILFSGAALQQAGMVYTTAGNAGFLTGLYVLLVPVLGLYWGQRIGPATMAGIAAALIGTYLLSVGANFEMNRGDILVLAGTIGWALHVQVVAAVVARHDATELAYIQFLACGAISLVAAVCFEPIELSGIANAATAIAYGGCISIGLGYTLQVVGQRWAHPSHAALIMSLESVFAALAGWLVLDERFTTRQTLGAALMLGGVTVAQRETERESRDA